MLVARLLATSCLDERLHRPRHIAIFDQASAQLVGDVLGDVARPALGGVEGDDAQRIAILAIDQVADQRLPIRSVWVGLWLGLAKPGSEVFKHQIGVRPFGCTHHATHRLLN